MSNNLPNTNTVLPTFSGFYNQSFPVDPQVYDVVLTFFLARTDGNRTAAEALTASVMTLAFNKGVDPLGMVSQFQNLKSSEGFKAALLSLLNTDRFPTSKLGYAVTPKTNSYILRNIGS